jgi:hyperosmotically inducible protein
MKARFTFAWVAAALLALSTVASAQGPDPRVARDVERALSAVTQLTIFDDVRAEVQDGVVHLSGQVTTPQKRAEAEKHVAGIGGVRGVRNDIAVLPASPSDDALRYRLARAIYGNPAFWTYAAMAHPPIHIVVEHGRVTLRGSVATHTERMLAQSLATGAGETSVTNELRTDAETAVKR